MTMLLDHLSAILIGGIVLLLMTNVQTRARETATARTMMYASKKQVLELATMIEQDLGNAGFDTPPEEDGLLAHVPATVQDVDVTQRFEFWSVVSNVRTRIRYDVVFDRVVVLDGMDTPLFELQRFEHDGAGWVPAGGSGPVLTGFIVGLRTDKNQATADLSAVRGLRLRLSLAVWPDVAEHSQLRGMRVLSWGVLLHPPQLR